jgi:hypothetical protein
VLGLLPVAGTTSPQAAPGGPGTSVPFAEVGSVAFSTSTDGFALVPTATGTYVARTQDQGRHWVLASSTALYRPGMPARDVVGAIGTGPDGTVYAYPGSDVGSVVDVSNDGGRRWVTSRFPGTVANVVANGSSLWALVDGPARSGAPYPPPPPAGWLYVAVDGGKSWARRSALPASVGPYDVLSAPTRSLAYALAPGEHNAYDGRYGGLAETTDGGRTWERVEDQPCDENASPRFDQDAELGGVGLREVWLACGISLPRGPGNVDLVLRSEDRGVHWALEATSTRWFTTPGTRPNFPATATVPPAGLPGTSLFSAKGAWLVLASPNLLVRTTNGGRTWADAAPAGVESQGPLQVLDAGGTVVVRTRSALWRLGTRGWQEVISARPVGPGPATPTGPGRAKFVTGLGEVASVPAGTAGTSPMAAEADGTGAPPQGSGPVTSRSFNAGFSPDQIVGTAGQVWLVSSGNGNGTGCRVGRLSPVSMALTTYPLAACGMNVTAGPGAMYLEVPVAEVKSETYAVHIERFSTSTHASAVFGAVSATMFLGSGIAHTQLAYSDGSLWFYANERGVPEALQLSPSTGAVERRFTSVPQIGGTEPLIAATPGYVWLAGGAGSGADFLRIDVHNGATRAVHLPGRYASVYDLVGTERRLFILYLAYPPGVGSTSHVGSFSPSGGQLARSPGEEVGTWLVPLGGALFSGGPSGSCNEHSLSVWRVDEQSLQTSIVAELHPPGGPCIDQGFRPVTTAGNSLFVLSGSALYRVAPPADELATRNGAERSGV